MNKYKFTAALFLICIIFSCDKYNLDRTNSFDPKSKNFKSVPQLTTTSATSITGNSAILGGSVTSDGGASIMTRGVCWSTTASPTTANSKTTDGTGTGTFASSLTGLTTNTKYYARAYATNSAGTAYGNEISFTTLNNIIFNPLLTYGSVTDIEGNTYKTIQIGTQIWMAENLRTSKYRDGTSIPIVSSSGSWGLLTTGAYCDYNNLPANSEIYGKLYNGYAVNSTHNLCPTGWHIPSDVELNQLVVFLGSSNVAGGKMKEIGTTHWSSPNTNADNSSGFTALPAGDRYFSTGDYGVLNQHGYFWGTNQYALTVKYDVSSASLTTAANINYGFSVRCINGELPVLPVLTTVSATSITLNAAISGGNITNDGGATIISKGICWSTTSTPTISGSKTIDGVGIGTFVSSLTGLLPGTTYYVRAYATNSAGTSYGNEVSFTTNPVVAATLTTTAVTSVTLTTAVSGGNITADGGSAITARGVCWATTTLPTISGSKTSDSNGTGSFISNLSGLLPGTTYYLRAYATNSAGTAYGNEVSFTTTPITLATLSTTSVTSITLTTAVSGGNITSNGGGTVTESGICWATTVDPTIAGSKTTDGTATGSFVSNLTGLLPGTTYHVRAYATNSAGTAYGLDVSFTTYSSGTTINDIDGNTYNTIAIGTQIWMAENLKTTKYNDGNSIPNVIDNTTWVNLTSGAYCWYNNDATAYKASYGALYNWYALDAASNGGKNVCPIGWHVSTNAEWTILTNYLGGESIAGGKLKETGTNHWRSPNTGATNESGFTALPGGWRIYTTGMFYDIYWDGYWWTSTEYSGGAYTKRLYCDLTSISNYNPQKNHGFSVRCLKDL